MAVNSPLPVAAELKPVNGIEIGFAEAGIKKPNRKDVLIMKLAPTATVAGVFTTNRFCAAPVQVSQANLAAAADSAGAAPIRALVVNTGNANAGTGESGLAKAQQTCAALAGLLGCNAQQILPFSTGVILEPLPVEKIVAALPAAIANLKPDNWFNAAEAIMTTDTQPKAASRSVTIGGHAVTMTGISKGAGMIRPNMATMLGFIATDARIVPALVQPLARTLADASFNRVTIDGDTSTNDSFVVIATQKAAHDPIESLDTPDGRLLLETMQEVSRLLAQAIVRDGEGATKFIAIRVEGGRDTAECRQVAYAVAHSPLVKTAFFASDPNLGRILAAVGYAGIDDLDQTGIDLHLDDVHVVVQGGRNPSYREEDGQRVMKRSEIEVRIGLGRGEASDTVWTCDLSHDYVTINADYRS